MSVPELLAAAAESSGSELSAQLGAGPTRDVVVIHGPPSDPAAAVMVTWSIHSGAALLLEPDPARWPLALVWARPTLVAATAPDLDRLAERLRRLERKPRRLQRRLGPLGRARAVVRVEGGGRPRRPWESAAWWRSLELPLLSCGLPGAPG